MSKEKSKISIGAIVCVLIAGYFLFGAIKSLKKSEGVNTSLVKDVTVVADGKLDSANEGKLVLVTGKVSFDAPVTFAEVDAPFDSFIVERVVEDYVKDDDGKLDWVEREEAKKDSESSYDDEFTTDDLYTQTRVVPISVGDFKIAKSELEDISANTTLVNKNLVICGLEFDGMFYTNPGRENGEAKKGDVRVQYTYYDMKDGYLSVLAKQQGTSLVPYSVEKESVFYVYSSDINSLDALKTKLAKSNKKDFILRLVLVGIILLIGVAILKANNKKAASKE